MQPPHLAAAAWTSSPPPAAVGSGAPDGSSRHTAGVLVLADEPTAQLDSENARRVIALMAELVRGRGVSAVAATHDPLLLDLADDVVELRDGRVV